MSDEKVTDGRRESTVPSFLPERCGDLLPSNSGKPLVSTDTVKYLDEVVFQNVPPIAVNGRFRGIVIPPDQMDYYEHNTIPL